MMPTGPTTGRTRTSSVKLGVAFKADEPGNITGIRFYKAAQNGGSHTIALWKTDGTQIATATVTNESTSGWQQASFDAPVAIAANTTYIASYTAPNGRYSHARRRPQFPNRAQSSAVGFQRSPVHLWHGRSTDSILNELFR